MKALMGPLRKEAVVGFTCWELKSHLFKVLVLPAFTYGTEVLGGNLQNSLWKVFEKGMMIHMMSHVKVHSSTTYQILLAGFNELPIEIALSSSLWVFNNGLSTYPPLS